MVKIANGQAYQLMAFGQMMFLANKCSCLRRTGHMEIKFIKRLFLYRSPEVSIPHLLSALCTILGQHSSSQNVIIGDFSINWTQESTRQSLYNLMIREKNFRQLIFGFTTDNRTIIDHLYRLNRRKNLCRYTRELLQRSQSNMGFY